MKGQARPSLCAAEREILKFDAALWERLRDGERSLAGAGEALGSSGAVCYIFPRLMGCT